MNKNTYLAVRSFPKRITALLILLGLPLGSLLGCSEQHPPTAAVHGKVTLNGKPLPVGAVMFSPISTKEKSRPAYGEIQPDGTFTLGTYDKEDGAIVGKHTVTVFGKSSRNQDPPPTAPGQKPPAATRPPFGQVQLVNRSFEVVAGKDNHFDIELTTQLLQQYGKSDD